MRPLAPWIGGKRNLSRHLASLIDATDHEIYLEPFVGMGGVFLRRERRPRAEAINDISQDVTTLFRILQRHYVAFLEMMRFQLTTRSEFERLSKVDPATLTDLERAARFLYLQRTAFGGKVEGRTFGVSPGTPARFDITKLGPMLEDVHSRLAGVVIERLPWRQFIERYDRSDALIYLDPPYHGSENDYGKGLFDRDQFAELAEVLASIDGRFVLSINDTPEIRETFDQFHSDQVSTVYTIAGGSNAKQVSELVITNFEPTSADLPLLRALD